MFGMFMLLRIYIDIHNIYNILMPTIIYDMK